MSVDNEDMEQRPGDVRDRLYAAPAIGHRCDADDSSVRPAISTKISSPEYKLTKRRSDNDIGVTSSHAAGVHLWNVDDCHLSQAAEKH